MLDHSIALQLRKNFFTLIILQVQKIPLENRMKMIQ